MSDGNSDRGWLAVIASWKTALAVVTRERDEARAERDEARAERDQTQAELSRHSRRLAEVIAERDQARGRCPDQVDGGRCAGLAGHEGEHYANARDRGAR